MSYLTVLKVINALALKMKSMFAIISAYFCSITLDIANSFPQK